MVLRIIGASAWPGATWAPPRAGRRPCASLVSKSRFSSPLGWGGNAAFGVQCPWMWFGQLCACRNITELSGEEKTSSLLSRDKPIPNRAEAAAGILEFLSWCWVGTNDGAAGHGDFEGSWR